MCRSDDTEMLAAWRAGDRSAGDALIERYYGSVFGFFRQRAGECVADDLAQRTFLACCEGVGRFRGDATFRSYLFAIAYRLMCKHFAAERRRAVAIPAEALLDPGEDPIEAVVQRHDGDLVRDALRQLPPECGQLLELHYCEQMTAAEAACALGIPEGTAKTRIRRGKLLLEQRFREKPGSP